MDRKGKTPIIAEFTAMFTLVAFAAAVFTLVVFAAAANAHSNPQGKQTHLVGLETESCQSALAGAEEQLVDRGSINPRLLNNIEDKCGVKCSIQFDAAHAPHLVCRMIIVAEEPPTPK